MKLEYILFFILGILTSVSTGMYCRHHSISYNNLYISIDIFTGSAFAIVGTMVSWACDTSIISTILISVFIVAFSFLLTYIVQNL